MKSYEVAAQGIARTFQNVALFKGMTTLDNIMTGRNLRMKRNLFWQALRRGPALDEEIANRRVCRGDHRLPRDRAYPQDACRGPALRLAEARRARPCAGRWSLSLLLLDEPMAGMNREEKEDMSRFMRRGQRVSSAPPLR